MSSFLHFKEAFFQISINKASKIFLRRLNVVDFSRELGVRCLHIGKIKFFFSNWLREFLFGIKKNFGFLPFTSLGIKDHNSYEINIKQRLGFRVSILR